MSDIACQMLHATTVCIDGRAAVIIGASGTGKSGLALQMIGLGASLLADDKTEICAKKSEKQTSLFARVPKALSGLIEARSVGILRLPYVAQAEVAFFVDLDQIEVDRLPPQRSFSILAQKAPLFHRAEGDHFAAALVQVLRYGRDA